jgi:hypothetical protein
LLPMILLSACHDLALRSAVAVLSFSVDSSGSVVWQAQLSEPFAICQF